MQLANDHDLHVAALRLAAARPDAMGVHLEDDGTNSVPVLIELTALRPGPDLRQGGVDTTHARLLAEAGEALPPVLVHRSTMSVIDGMHRLLAASFRGQSHIPTVFFDGTDAEALAASVRLNTCHGKPLTLAERKRAAERIIRANPEWSSRFVANTCGLSPRTIAAVRRRATGGGTQSRARVGQDGRLRPVDPAAGRVRAAEVLKQSPTASLRSVARASGTSVATVRDVRHRLGAGRDPVPEGISRAPAADESAPDGAAYMASEDSAFRASSKAQRFAYWFDSQTIDCADWEGLIDGVPLSRVYLLCDEARRRATEWTALSNALEARIRGS